MTRDTTTRSARSEPLTSRPSDGASAAPTVVGVGIVTQQVLLADMLRLLLDRAADLALVGIAATGADGVILAAHPAIAVLLLDLRLPDLSGIELVQRLQAADRGPAIVLLSDSYHSWSVEGLAALGAHAFVSKRDPGGYAALAATIRAVALTQSDRATDEEQPTAAHGERLTHREQQVLRLIAQSKRNKEIAAVLALSRPTVETHLRNLYAKLGVTSRTAAVHHARELGLLP
jgi:DNA-binding NarL/FixJ family response regulator